MVAELKMPQERRRNVRLPVSLAAHCQIGHRYLRELLSDVSAGGLFVRTSVAAREGTPVRVALALPYADGPRFCTLTGTIVRAEHDPCGQGGGLAVSFDEGTGEFDREMLRGFLSLWGARRFGRA